MLLMPRKPKTGGARAVKLSLKFRVNFSNFRIRTRIYAGFGAVILLGAAVTGFGVWQFTTLGQDVDRLVAAGADVSRGLEVNRIVELLRRAALQYKTSGDEAATKEFAE